MLLELGRISAERLRGLNPAKTLFFIPVGPLEDHGPHLPLGLDLYEAEELCRLEALRLEQDRPDWTCVLLPSAPLGLESNGNGMALTVRAHVLRDWIVDAVRGLSRAGFQYFICFSGHLGPRQLTAIEEAGKILRRPFTGGIRNRRPILMSASSALVSWREVLRAPFWLDPEEHGGRRDTSVALALPGLSVDPAFMHLPPRPREKEGAVSRFLDRLRRRDQGYWGVPSQADRELGRQELREQVEKILSPLKLVLDGAPPRSRFRSWYSVIPLNWSFFRAWILTFLILLVMALWVRIQMSV